MHTRRRRRADPAYVRVSEHLCDDVTNHSSVRAGVIGACRAGLPIVLVHLCRGQDLYNTLNSRWFHARNSVDPTKLGTGTESDTTPPGGRHVGAVAFLK